MRHRPWRKRAGGAETRQFSARPELAGGSLDRMPVLLMARAVVACPAFGGRKPDDNFGSESTFRAMRSLFLGMLALFACAHADAANRGL